MPSGAVAKKPVSSLKKTLKISNVKDLAGSLRKALLNVASGNWNDLYDNKEELLRNLGIGTTEEELAWRLISRAMLSAVLDLLDDNSKNFYFPSNHELDLHIEFMMQDGELSVGPDFFDDPASSPIVGRMQAYLYEWLKASGITAKSETAFVERLPSYFVFSLNDEWRAGKPAYEPLREYYDTPFTKAQTMEEDWTRYRAYLRKEVDKPVFGGNFSLKQLYIPLNASYQPPSAGDAKYERFLGVRARAEHGKTRPDEDGKAKPIVTELEDYLNNWLENNEPSDAVRIVSGGPGSGKSSFAKMFAASLPEHQKVLFIPLHLIDISGDFMAAIVRYLRQDFHDNPLDNADNLLIIFDGLDELTQVGGVYSEAARNFVDKVDRQLLMQNRDKRSICVLYTGRVVVVQSIEKIFKNDPVLSLLPFWLKEEERARYSDEGGLLKNDYRSLWWYKYGILTENLYDTVSEAFSEGRLAEITAQPLLNYLVALSYGAEEPGAFKIDNLNSVYAKLIHDLFRRDWDKQQIPSMRGMKEDDYLLALEAIAVAAWHGSGRTVTVEEIVEYCGDKSEFSVQWDAFRKSAKDGAANLLTAFYFKQVEERHDGKQSFEFTHKSFREYLTVQRMVRLLGYMQELFDEQAQKPNRNLRPEKNALESWHNLCSPTPMDFDLYQFLCDEMKLRSKDTVLAWQKMVCQLIEYVVANGMPPCNPRPEFSKEEDRLYRNAEMALLAVHSACARVTGEVIHINWGKEKTEAGQWLTRLRGQRGIAEELYWKILNHLDLSYCNLDGNDFINADLSYANLERISAYATLFDFAQLIGACLERAFLFRTRLENANLTGVHLEGAYMLYAYLSGANLEGANLEGANLEGANLEHAHLESANLEGANLEGARLKGATVQNADFLGARLNAATKKSLLNRGAKI